MGMSRAESRQSEEIAPLSLQQSLEADRDALVFTCGAVDLITDPFERHSTKGWISRCSSPCAAAASIIALEPRSTRRTAAE